VSIERVITYCVRCEGPCRKTLGHRGEASDVAHLFLTREDAADAAGRVQWLDDDNRHLCPACRRTVEETR